MTKLTTTQIEFILQQLKEGKVLTLEVQGYFVSECIYNEGQYYKTWLDRRENIRGQDLVTEYTVRSYLEEDKDGNGLNFWNRFQPK
ncbi:MAG: hypothetical protein GY810_22795 [Aureispira sp.]|nr:hypothetical protein [Aureispira sp.]